MISKTFNRQIWLLCTLLQYKRISLADIKQLWISSPISDGKPYAERTFHMHKNAIEEMFDINIECDVYDGNKYYIEDLESLEKDKVRQWLINSFSVSNMIEESRQIPERIILDEVPGGAMFLPKAIEAIKLSRVLKISYKAPGEKEPAFFFMCPYCLKEHRQRWYLLGWIKEREALRHFAFDRMQYVEMTSETYTYPKDFNPENYYAHSIGISVEEEKPVETIRLRVYGKQVELFRSLPMHKSQREVGKGDNYCDFEYKLRINSELKRELLSKANNIEVIAPEHLRKAMIKEARSILNRYGNS